MSASSQGSLASQSASPINVRIGLAQVATLDDDREQRQQQEWSFSQLSQVATAGTHQLQQIARTRQGSGYRPSFSEEGEMEMATCPNESPRLISPWMDSPMATMEPSRESTDDPNQSMGL